MAKVGINTGTSANAGDGSTLRAGANIINDNFNELYTALEVDSGNTGFGKRVIPSTSNESR